MARRYAWEQRQALALCRQESWILPLPLRHGHAASSRHQEGASLAGKRHACLQAQVSCDGVHRRRVADTIMQYVLRRKGKQMRPMFVFLSARLHGGLQPDGTLVDRAYTAGSSSSSCTRPRWSTTTSWTKARCVGGVQHPSPVAEENRGARGGLPALARAPCGGGRRGVRFAENHVSRGPRNERR